MSESEAAKKKALVINDTERILHYCETSTATTMVEGRDVQIPMHKSHALIPGVNVVDNDKWLEQFQLSPVFKHHRHTGKVRVLPVPEDKGKQLAGLTGFSADDAIEFVNKTFVLGLLDEWAQVDKRQDVTAAIKKQHAYVKSELEAPEQEDRIMFKAPAAGAASHMRI